MKHCKECGFAMSVKLVGDLCPKCTQTQDGLGPCPLGCGGTGSTRGNCNLAWCTNDECDLAEHCEIDMPISTWNKLSLRANKNGLIFPYSFPIWENPEACPGCGGLNVFAFDKKIGACIDCKKQWHLKNEATKKKEGE